MTGLPTDVESGFPSTVVVLRDLFYKKAKTDVNFAFKKNGKIIKTTYKAHKLVLSIWSPFFASYFYKQNEELETPIVFDDIDPDAFYFMLRFMYDDSPEMKSFAKALEIYKVASKFDVTKLIIDSLIFVKNYDPQVSDVLYCLDTALYMNLKSAIVKCCTFIQENTLTVLQSCNLSKVSLPVVLYLLDLPSFSLSSYIVFLEWVFSWAENTDLNSNEELCCSFVLRQFKPRLSFLSLSSKEFVQFYSKHEQQLSQDVMNAEEALNILMNIITPSSHLLPDWLCKEFVYRPSENRINKIVTS